MTQKNPEFRYAAKMGLFSYEEEKKLAQEFAKNHALKTYEEWKGIMLEEYTESGYQGYADNWLFLKQNVWRLLRCKGSKAWAVFWRSVKNVIGITSVTEHGIAMF